MINSPNTAKVAVVAYCNNLSSSCLAGACKMIQGVWVDFTLGLNPKWWKRVEHSSTCQTSLSSWISIAVSGLCEEERAAEPLRI